MEVLPLPKPSKGPMFFVGLWPGSSPAPPNCILAAFMASGT